MQYSPKLKVAMEEIKAVLTKHDIAAFIVLYSPGFIEYLNKINPSYSCAFLGDNEFRVRLKTSEVCKERARELAEGTRKMIHAMTEVILLHAKGYMDFDEMLAKHWGGEFGDSDHSSHTSQNS